MDCVYLQAAHVNNDPENPHAELVCLCPSCHMRMDRAKEKLERTSQRRRGYELTSTDRLVAAVAAGGLTLTSVSEGYHWKVEGTDYEGSTTTAVSAVSHAIAKLRSVLKNPKYGIEVLSTVEYSKGVAPTRYSRRIH